jgi:hypothetical protein
MFVYNLIMFYPQAAVYEDVYVNIEKKDTLTQIDIIRCARKVKKGQSKSSSAAFFSLPCRRLPSPSSYSPLTAHPSGERQSKRISAASAPLPSRRPSSSSPHLHLPRSSAVASRLLSPATTTRHRSQGLAGQRARGMLLLFSA